MEKKLLPTEIEEWNIHQKIIGIMSELHYISKGEKTVNGQYRFVSHDQVTAKIHPLLVKYRLTVIPTVEEMTQDGNRTIVRLLVSFVNADKPEENFTERFISYGIDGGGVTKDGRSIPAGDKGPGKAISYAFKYALLKTFCLETGDDPDNDANASYEPPKCLEFETLLPVMAKKDRQRLENFLAYSSHILEKHIEDVKREAVTRMDKFMESFKKWKPKEE